MIIKLKQNAKSEDVSKLVKQLESEGFEIHKSLGFNYEIFGVIGDTSTFDVKKLYAYDCVDKVIRILEAYEQINKTPVNKVIKINDIEIGGDNLVIIGGPCSVESYDQVDKIAKSIKEAGAHVLRGGAYKPRTSPYSYQGMGLEGLKILREVADKYNLLVISEILDKDHIDEFINYVDIIQVGARNMQNFPLLKELGKTNKPILIKRGFGNTIEEWLMSAEYIISEGNKDVILCERGIRTFENMTRNTLDISSIPLVKKLSNLPIIVDPSHAAGKWDLIESLSKAAIAGGADGLMIEVHHEPERALSDGAQSLKPKNFSDLMLKIKRIAEAIDRYIK